MHEPSNLMWLSKALSTLVRTNGSRNSSGNSGFVTALMIVLVFGMIQPTTSSTFSSNYSSILSSNSPTFSRPDNSTRSYYYEAIEVVVYMTSTYTFTSYSSMDTCGYLYNYSFNPSYASQNLITSDDDGNGNSQFRITTSLKAGLTYVLVVTTFDNNVGQSFSITAVGPYSVYMVSITPSSSAPWPSSSSYSPSYSPSYPTTTSSGAPWPSSSSSYAPWPSTTSSSAPWPSSSSSYSPSYSPSYPNTTSSGAPWPSSSSSYSPSYSPSYPTSTSSGATWPSSSSYSPSYSPSYPTTTSSGAPWPSSSSYSPSYPTTTSSGAPWPSSSPSYSPSYPTTTSSGAPWPSSSSSYSPSYSPSYPTSTSSGATWPSSSSYSPSYSPSWATTSSSYAPWPSSSSSYAPWPTTSSSGAPWPSSSSSYAPWPSTTSSNIPTVSTMTTSPAVTTNFSNILSSSSPRFSRPNANPGNYYYQAIQVTTYTTGIYTFKSNSSIDTYGCLYQSFFDSSNPSRNVITCDDDNAGNQQFLISQSLQSGRIYILVVTTYSNNTLGSYSITAAGSTWVSMTLVTPTTYTSMVTTTTTSPDMISSYSGILSSSSSRFSRPNGNTGTYYYQAIQVTAYTNGIYTFKSSSSMNTYGCFYEFSFDPSNPSRNLFMCNDDGGSGGQFLISSRLQFGTIYILVVTTYSNTMTGSYSITAVGPSRVSMTSMVPPTYTSTARIPTTAPVVTSAYSGILSSSSPRFSRPYGDGLSNYYYQAIQVTTYTSGTYTFKSSSSIDTYGCFYELSFNPSFPSRNLAICDDDNAGNQQFLINRILQSGSTYILVVTTHSRVITGSYSIIAMGLTSVYMTSITPSTIPSTSPTTPTVPVTAATTSSDITSTYSGIWSSNSGKFSRPNGDGHSNYYYQAIQVITYAPNTYTFKSISSIDTYGCFYEFYFDPSDPYRNLITCNDDGSSPQQFLINSHLQSGRTYILVATTFTGGMTGRYSITAVGPSWISMTLITPSTYTSSLTMPTTSYSITSTYNGALSSTSSRFSRPNGNTGSYYYQAIQVTTYTSGTYTFSSSSSIDAYGCFYEFSFDPSYPSRNLIVCDDDSGDSQQFSITHGLYSERKYFLVMTTFKSGISGRYSITAIGSRSVNMYSFTPSNESGSHSLSTSQVVGIVSGCLILCVGILSVCAHRKKRQPNSTPRYRPSRNNRSTTSQNVPMADLNRNVTRVTSRPPPYTIPPATIPVGIHEELPPSYESILASLPPQGQTKVNRY